MAIFGTNFPTALDDAISLPSGGNRAVSSLSAGIGAADTSIALVDATAFDSAGAITIQNERIWYQGKVGNTLTGCLRGQDGSVAATHAIAVEVRQNFTAAHLSALRAAIVAIETKMGTFTDVPNGTLSLTEVFKSFSAGASRWGPITPAEIAQWLTFNPLNPAIDVNPGVLVNGSMGLWQRGTGPWTADGIYTADMWKTVLGAGAAISVQADDTERAYPASFRSMRVIYTHGGTESKLIQRYSDWFQTRGKTITFRCWVKTSSPSAARLAISDGVSTVYSSFHTGDGTWQYLRVTHVVSTSNSYLDVWLTLDASTTVWFDNADLLIGDVPNDVPYWSSDPVLEKWRCERYYAKIPINLQWIASAGGQTMIFPLNWLNMQVIPTPTVFTVGTRTNVSGSPSYTATATMGGYVSVTSAAAGVVSIMGEVLALDGPLV